MSLIIILPLYVNLLTLSNYYKLSDLKLLFFCLLLKLTISEGDAKIKY